MSSPHMSPGSSGSCHETPGCGCREPGGWDRRDFLKTLAAAGAGALASGPLTAMAGPFTGNDFEKLVPADKKLSPGWVSSLTARGRRTVYRGNDLEKIGMPVGGVCAGQLYVGGDGRLWHWDVFNQEIHTNDAHYAKPLTPASPLEQGFALRVECEGKVILRPLDSAHWGEVSFTGEYPIAYVNYQDGECPVTVACEVFSPFIPLNTADSSLPVTILEFTLTNRREADATVEIAGWLQNAACLFSGEMRGGLRHNRLVRNDGMLALECTAREATGPKPQTRPDIVFENFERDRWEPWTATGSAFGQGPVLVANIPAYQGKVGGTGSRVLNSHASAPGGDVGEKDSAQGSLVSPPFQIERNFIRFLIGGGAHKGRTCVNLLMGDKVVLSATGRNDNRMQPARWNVRKWLGQTARLQVVDAESGGWGNIGLDEIVFTDAPKEASGALAEEPDFGSMTLALLDAKPGDGGWSAVPEGSLPDCLFPGGEPTNESASRDFDQKLAGALKRRLHLPPGGSAKVSFVLAWHFPNQAMARLPKGRFYATRFDSALAVTRYVRAEYSRLCAETRLWHDTWYDSTLPYWFLDRTFLNTSILASSTCHRFGDGRFYGWEGVGCCAGTCTHVWHYAQAVGRLFPELERLLRERVDFGLAQQPNGAIHFRGEFNQGPAVDGQAGSVLRALREHQVSSDDGFLKRNWPQIRRATEWLIAQDANGDGLIEDGQHNTLDADWHGPVAWLSGLYLAALSAAATMAQEVGDPEFARTCDAILERGRRKLVSELFDGGYFINKPDPRHPEAINSGTGCHIDQVFGQSWAFQLGLPRVLPANETRQALTALWRYNFTPDVGPYREVHKSGRWYAMPGEAGLLMCTFPRSDWDFEKARGKGHGGFAGYFNECMNGFEYQVAGHMIREGMLTEGLAITRAVHDRYHPSRRNPWNEVECGDHYARSMASYGVFLAACGFEYHGPQGRLGFAPRLNPKQFKAAFTGASGWGSYEQQFEAARGEGELRLLWGSLRLKTLALEVPGGTIVNRVTARLDGRDQELRLVSQGNRFELVFPRDVLLAAGASLKLEFT